MEAAEVMLEMSEEFLESKQMDEAVIRSTVTEEWMLEKFDDIEERMREFEAFLEEEDIREETTEGYQHLEKGVGLGYVKID